MKEIRITQNGKTANYIRFCEEFMNGENCEVMLTAIGRCVTKAVIVSEVICSKFDLIKQNLVFTDNESGKSGISIKLVKRIL